MDDQPGACDGRGQQRCTSLTHRSGGLTAMNGLFATARQPTVTAMPVEFEALAPPPLLLPGESLDHYQALRQAIFTDLAPRSAIEWLLAIDVAELSWEIQRCRLLRHKLLETYRQKGD